MTALMTWDEVQKAIARIREDECKKAGVSVDQYLHELAMAINKTKNEKHDGP